MWVRWQNIAAGEWELCSTYLGEALDKMERKLRRDLGAFFIPYPRHY